MTTLDMSKYTVLHERFVGSHSYCQAKIYRLNRKDWWLDESKPPTLGIFNRFKERMYHWSDGYRITDSDLARYGRWEIHMIKIIPKKGVRQ